VISHRLYRSLAGAFITLLTALLACTGSAATAPPPAAPLTDAEKIEALIRTVEARKDLQFIRLGSMHSAGEAASMLRVKLSFAGDRVKTVDDFIDHVATRTMSGSPYFVVYPDGRQVPSAEFLREELKRIERSAAPAAPTARKP
jgi:hypothetical protein